MVPVTTKVAKEPLPVAVMPLDVIVVVDVAKANTKRKETKTERKTERVFWFVFIKFTR